MIYRFGNFALDTELLELRSMQNPVALEPQVFTLLAYLIENRSHVVSKQELIDTVWEGRIVSDDTLNSRINAARRAVGDTGTAQGIIRTMVRRGFRFVAEIDVLDSPPPARAPSADDLPASAGPEDRQKAPLPLPERPSIAALPFTNLSGDKEQEYLSDGITEDIITELSRFSELFAIARNSSFQYKGKATDVRQVGRDLGVRYVLDVVRAGAHSALAERLSAAPPLPDKPSIAVLPFENMSGDPDQEYFADGMVEEITTALSRFKWLFVIARNSSFTFKGRAVDIKEVGRRLGVHYVLEGSVRRASGKVRIAGQLINAVTGAHIWADRFERDLTDVFALQDEVTVAVVSAVQPKLLQTEIALATRRRPENLTAYDFYLRAMPQYYLSTREGNAEAMRLAHRALELDPRFGLVAALAGTCHMQNVLWGCAADPQFDRKEAVRLLRLALSLDDSDPDILACAAVISAFMVGDCEGEIEMADRAVALNPNSFRAWGWRGWVYRVAGLPEEAIRSFERAIRMSPVDPDLYRSFAGMGYAFIDLGRFDEAIVAGKKAQRQNPFFSATHRCLASAFAHLGRDAEAREAAARLLEVDPTFTISAWIARGGQANARLLTEGLRKAGLPE